MAPGQTWASRAKPDHIWTVVSVGPEGVVVTFLSVLEGWSIKPGAPVDIAWPELEDALRRGTIERIA